MAKQETSRKSGEIKCPSKLQDYIDSLSPQEALIAKATLEECNKRTAPYLLGIYLPTKEERE
ncbi:hypothetical protein LCGC14_1369590 [marine sediment metagenome]|uniref:Uncharacterized protein n=1 Tax=marine sediment metagenome TaxID=412755 RepID=A0A0F9KRP0_9ZZZZ